MEQIISPIKCINCDHLFHGRYCSNCGEKINIAREKTVIHFLKEVVKSFTLSDSKLLRTFKYLMFHPGKLSQEHRLGKRIKYTSPLQLFLLANLLYFIFQPMDVLNTSLRNQDQQMYKGVAKSITTLKLDAENLTFEQLEKKYNSRSESISKILLIVIVLIFAVALQLLFFNKRLLYYDHLIFGLHFFSFLIFTFFLIMPTLIYWIATFATNLNITIDQFFVNEDFLIVFLMLPLIITYLWIAVRRYYKTPKFKTFIFCFILFFFTLVNIVFYKFLIFNITMLFI